MVRVPSAQVIKKADFQFEKYFLRKFRLRGLQDDYFFIDIIVMCFFFLFIFPNMRSLSNR